MEMTPFELERALIGRMAARTCQNLIGKYCFYRTSMRGGDILSMWSKDPDTRIEMPWGVYDGIDSVRRYIIDEQYTHEDTEGRRGVLIVNALSTQVFEVAKDTKTARGAWFCQGLDTRITDGKVDCRWIWTKYGLDFIFENGEWKIWHMAVFPMVDTAYETEWYNNPKMEISQFKGVKADRKPTTRSLWNMHEDNPYPLGHPATPKPYDNFDLDVGYGY